MRCLTFLTIWLALTLPAPVPAAYESTGHASGPLTIQRIVPTGEDVPAARQIVIEFDRPVVAIGNMARNGDELPILIEPALECEWRWLNTQSLACQLNEQSALQAATRYSITVSPGMSTLDGSVMSETVHHSFITERPDVRWSAFTTWRAPGHPVIQVVFNQPVTAASVVQHLYFSPLDGGDRQAVEIFTDGETQLEDPSDVWRLHPATELPLDTPMVLKIEPGLRGSGPESGASDRVIVQFDTFPDFEFLGVSCFEGDSDEWVEIPAQLPYRDQPLCDPLHGVGMIFSVPVLAEQVKHHATLTPDLAGARKDYDPWANRLGYSYLGAAHTRGQIYVVWFPENLKADQDYEITTVPGALSDEFSRPLTSPVQMHFKTAHRRPNLLLNHPKAVIEKDIDSDVPLYVTNLDRVRLGFSRLTNTERSKNIQRQVQIPQVEDISFAVPMELRQMLEGNSGAVSGTMQGDPQPPHTEQILSFFAEVTPFQVFFKLGHFNSSAWVTDLRTGLPVPGATVTLYPDTYAALSSEPTSVHGPVTTDRDGLAILPGLEVIDPGLHLVNEWREEWPRWFVKVTLDDDLALLPLDQNFQSWSRGVWPSSRLRFGHVRTWGTTAQGVYRVGDTIQYKIYVRNQDNEQLVPAPRDIYTLVVVDPQGREVEKRENLQLSAFGAIDGELEVPPGAPVGWYRFVLSANFYNEHPWEPLRVLVSDFTPSPFRVRTELNSDVFDAGQTITVTTSAALHSGGPYTGAEARVTARVRPRYFSTTHPIAENFYFQTQTDQVSNWTEIHQSVGLLSDEGERRTLFPLEESGLQYGDLQVESAVRDDRGKYVANVASARVVTRDRFVGLRNTRWVYDEDEPATIEHLVVDRDGNPVAGVPVTVLVEQEVITAARVKGAGNAYLTRYDRTWETRHTCESVSTTDPEGCVFTPLAPGSFRITATVVDTRGRNQSSQIGAWVAGQGAVLWEQPNDTQLTLIPENDEVMVGDKARFLVRNPYPGAYALITIERYGVIEQRVQRLETSTPIIEVDMKPEHLPGVYLSVVVMSPRVSAPIQGGVDLGKPTFRMGYLSIPVNDPYKQLDIELTPDKSKFKPREQVHVEVSVRSKAGTGEPVELAVAVLDEAVFDLVHGGARYFDPYRGFYVLEPLDVLNYSLLTALVGRQKFEKKGASSGGDGGPGLGLRSDFRFVSYWNPSIETDREGRASFNFTVPDNLTGWRILVLGVTANDKLGLGQTSIQVSRPTELRPVMPNQVIAGDAFQAGFSVMNRTADPRAVSVVISAADDSGEIASNRVVVTLAPYERRRIDTPVETTRSGLIRFTASAGDALDHDQLTHELPVKKRRSLVSAANHGTTTGNEVFETITIPSGVYADSGEISVSFSPSVIANVQGAFEYMRDYPYRCWEQRLSRGVMASHYGNLRDYLPERLQWDGSQALVVETLKDAYRFQAPNGGMVFWIAHDEYASPYLSAYTALAFNWLRAAGHDVPTDVESRLHVYLERLLKDDIMETFYSRGMRSSIRAVALAALAVHGKITAEDLLRYEAHIPYMSLFARTQYLDALHLVSATSPGVETLVHDLFSHANVSGGKFQFTEIADTDHQPLLATPLRANCAILSTLVTLGEDARHASSVGDVPYKLVRTITQTRGNRDHFENTQENVFCMNSLIAFARAYETTKPDMEVTARLDGTLLGETTFDDLRDPGTRFSAPLVQTDIGTEKQVEIQRTGDGRLYYVTRLTYAPFGGFDTPTNSGIDIRREYSVQREGVWVPLVSPMHISRGELVRVDIYLSLPGARHFVVVDDPVPGGLEPVNRDLATASMVDADAGAFKRDAHSWWHSQDDWVSYGVSRWSFYHQELRHDSARFFSDYLPAGNYHLSYTAQAIATGTFTVMPVHAEEMYDPDIFGKGMSGELEVTD